MKRAPDAVGDSSGREPGAHATDARQEEATGTLGALRAVAHAASADDAAIVHAIAESLVVEASLGRPPAGATIQVDEALRRATQTDRPAQLPCRAWWATLADPSALGRPSAGRLLIVPLRIDGDPAGLLMLGRQEDLPFSAAEVDAAERLGVLAALLLRDAHDLREVRAAERAERERVSIVVHELRSPLTVINGYLTMLDEGTVGALPERAASLVRTLVEQAARVSAIVDEILLAGRVDEGTVGLSTRSLICVDLLGRALARSSGHAALVGASVTCDAPGGLAVLADPESVDRILDNLVANALVHGGQAPSIALMAEADAGVVAIRVRDDGPGVPHELRDAVFERFVRGTDDTPGSGLGLYISRGLAKLMGGDLVLETPPSGSGATFGLRLPAAG